MTHFPVWRLLDGVLCSQRQSKCNVWTCLVIAGVATGAERVQRQQNNTDAVFTHVNSLIGQVNGHLYRLLDDADDVTL